MVRKTVQAVSASQACRQRMLKAREDLPKSVGQQDVLQFIVLEAPHLNQLTYTTRWHNAWLGRVADPEFTDLVERAVPHFKKIYADMNKRLSKLKMKKPRTKQSA